MKPNTSFKQYFIQNKFAIVTSILSSVILILIIILLILLTQRSSVDNTLNPSNNVSLTTTANDNPLYVTTSVPAASETVSPTSQFTHTPIPLITDAPTATPSPYKDSGNPQGTSLTVSFARKDGIIYFRMSGSTYYRPKSNSGHDYEQMYDMDETEPLKNLKWYNLMEAAGGLKGISAAINPNTQNFAFVLYLNNISGNPFKPLTYTQVYYYDITSQSLSKYYDLTGTLMRNLDDGVTAISISDDGKYVAFNFHISSENRDVTRMINFSTKVTQDTAITSYFKWRTDGKYEYKDYNATDSDPIKTGVMNY